jgi:outer membrane protein OmpA-like peptidoglycan-associated protein
MTTAFRWLVALTVISLGGVAQATVNVSDYSLGTQRVNSSGMVTVVVQHSGVSDDVGTLSKPVSTDCDAFSFDTAALPVTLNASDTLDVPATFTPTARRSYSCLVTVEAVDSSPLATFTISGQGVAPVLAVSAATLDLGNVQVAGGSAQLTFDVQNTTGDAGQDLTVSSVNLGGAQAADFSQMSTLAPIAPGGAITVTVTFDPLATGPRDATLTVFADDPVDPDEVVSLVGVGTSLIIDVTPDTIAFGNVRTGQSPTLDATVTNLGSGASLTVMSASLSGGSGWITFTASPEVGCDGQVSCDYVPDLTLAPLGTATVGLRCAPPFGASGSVTATLALSSNTDGGGDSSSTVTCTAVEPDVNLSVTTLDFGNVNVGSSADLTLTVSNPGTALLTYTLAEGGANPGDYSFTPACIMASPCTLAAGGSADFTVTFAPTVDGARSATILVDSDDPDEPSLTVDLAGNGRGSQLTKVAPGGGTVVFGDVNVGVTASMTLTLRNDGNEDLVVGNIALSDAHFAVVGATFPLSIAPGNQTDFELTCLPTARGALAATVSVPNSSYNLPAFTMNATCNGIAGELTATPGTLAFGNVRNDTTVDLTLVLRNIGELPVTIDAGTSVVTPDNVGYTAAGIPTSLASGGQVTVTVTFAPTATMDGGAASLLIDSNWNDVTVTLSGNGLSNGIDTSVDILDFGDVRWDDSRTLTLDILNEGESDFEVEMLSLSNAVDFGILGSVTLPLVVSAGGQVTLNIEAHPNDVLLGALTGQLTIVTDIPSAANSKVVDLAVNSTSPALSVDPGMVVDFGLVDVDDPAGRTLTLRLRNTGDGSMDVQGVTGLGGPGTVFSGTFTPASVNPGSSLDLDVRYVPLAERPAGSDETQQLVFTVDGLYDPASPDPGPSAVTVTLRGRGIDRHIDPGPAITFPDTFRNPGAAAPVETLLVTNTGEANLVLSAVMLTGDAAFRLLDTAATTVMGGQTASFRVEFAPTMAGASYSGMVAINHDDDDRGDGLMALIPLAGRGVLREVAVTPTIDVGVVTVGLPVQLRDALELVNLSSSLTFQLRDIAVVGGADDFAIEGPTQRALGPAERVTYSLSFTPDAPGPFTTTLEVFLDDDPDAHARVQLVGNSIDVVVHGGGGCASGRGPGGALVLLVVVALGKRRRRASRVGALALLVAVSVAAAPSPASAQGMSELRVSTFEPLLAIDDELFQVQSATVGASSAWAVGLTLSHAVDPLQIEVRCGAGCPAGIAEGQMDVPIASQTLASLGGVYAFARRYEVGVHVPILMQSGDDPVFSAAPAHGTSLGQIGFHGKAQLWRQRQLSLGASVALTLPTARSGQYLGDSATAHVQALGSWRRGRVLASVNAGFLARETVHFASLEQGSELTYGVGGGYRVLEKLWVAGELFGGMATRHPETGTMPLQLIAGVRYRATPAISVAGGLGTGVVAGVGVPAARGFVMVSYSPHARPLSPLRGRSASEPGGDEGDDGAPRDRDGDGLVAGIDDCDDMAEDQDGFEDDDGCPDDDNDGDEIADGRDRCPDQAEDVDGLADQDGCPDLDDDRDGIADPGDRCPGQEEVINGVDDNDGCPDEGDSLVLLSADRIELFASVEFVGQTARLHQKGNNLLSQVAATLRAHPELLRVRVTAHVHPRGSADSDKELSVQRAAMVRRWLIDWGVAESRLDERGLGSEKPLVADRQGAAAINDRIEFIIVDKE